jgi:hypothetical protein
VFQKALNRSQRSSQNLKKIIIIISRWCNIILLNAHAPTEEKGDDSKDSFYEEAEGGFDHFPKYHVKILLGDFNAKVGREDTLKPTVGNGK